MVDFCLVLRLVASLKVHFKVFRGIAPFTCLCSRTRFFLA